MNLFLVMIVSIMWSSINRSDRLKCIEEKHEKYQRGLCEGARIYGGEGAFSTLVDQGICDKDL